jgi:hypothetical protein
MINASALLTIAGICASSPILAGETHPNWQGTPLETMGWSPVDYDDHMQMFYRFPQSQPNGPLKRVWSRTEFDGTGYPINGRAARNMSLVMLAEMDCAGVRWRTVSGRKYSKNNLQGTSESNGDTIAGPWNYAPPGSTADELFKTACGSKGQ